MSLSIQRDTRWCMKSTLNSNLRQDTNFTTFVLRKSVSIHGFLIFASSILMVLVILLENDVFKLSIYLDIYIFLSVGILPAQNVEASLLRTLNLRKHSSWGVYCTNKTSQVLTLKLTADLSCKPSSSIDITENV